MKIQKMVQNSIAKTYVVFENNNDLWWSKLLKKGFRHCYILQETAGGYLEINSMSNRLVAGVIYNEEYLAYLKVIHRAKVVEVEPEAVKLKPAPIGFFTCVEAVKRYLGIYNFWVQTPYALYRQLKVVGKKS